MPEKSRGGKLIAAIYAGAVRPDATVGEGTACAQSGITEIVVQRFKDWDKGRQVESQDYRIERKEER